MGGLSADSLLGQGDKVSRVLRYEAATFPAGKVQLLLVRRLRLLQPEGAYRVESPSAKELSDLRREVGVQIELHAFRKRPGYFASTASGVSAAFSAISESISWRYLL